MLSDLERNTLASIRQRLVDGHGTPTPNDGLYLLDLVDRLARITPLDFSFPPYAALVSPVGNAAYAMRLDRIMPREKILSIHPDGPRRPVADWTISCNVCEADLLVRPYVSLVDPRTPEALETLRQNTFSLSLDGDVIVDDFPLRDILVGLDGFGMVRTPLSLQGLANDVQFLACAAVLNAGPQPAAIGPGAIMPMANNGGWMADGTQQYGVFMPNGLTVSIALGDIPDGPPMEIALGLVSARYSTKNKSSRKQDWSPRDPA